MRQTLSIAVPGLAVCVLAVIAFGALLSAAHGRAGVLLLTVFAIDSALLMAIAVFMARGRVSRASAMESHASRQTSTSAHGLSCTAEASGDPIAQSTDRRRP